ncbi:MAG: EamA family transporter, partial [Roseibium sp.]
GLVSLVAGLLGFAGIALMFEPQILGTRIDYAAMRGLGFCALGTLSFCLGNMLSASNQQKGLPVTPATAWGMVYGTLFLALFATVKGSNFAIEPSPVYIASLVYLAIIASVVAFGSYLTLLGRIGSARAGYATVIFPIVALSISTVFEGYQWTGSAMLGLVCVLFGNILMLRGR